MYIISLYNPCRPVWYVPFNAKDYTILKLGVKGLKKLIDLNFIGF